MYNLLISLGAATLTFIILFFSFNFWAAIFPAVIVLVAIYIVLSRKTYGVFQTIMMNMQLEFQRLSKVKNPQQRSIEPAVKMLKEGYPLGRWQFFIKPQLDAQIGVIYFTNGKPKAALPYLKKAFLRHWSAQGMLATYYYNNKMYDEMHSTFAAALKANKKVALLYNMYAWILLELNKKDDAKKILQQGIKYLPENEELKKSLINVQNDKKIRLKGYGDEWYQFRLEKHPREIQAQKPMFKQSKKQRIRRG